MTNNHPPTALDRENGHRVGKKPDYLDSIVTVKRARKPLRCDSCGEQIEAGDEYVRHSLPPTGFDASNGHWQTLRMCGWWTSDCRRYWEIDAKERAGDLTVIGV